MKPLERIFEKACRHPRHIVLAEGHDPRVQQAGLNAVERGLAQITLLGRIGRLEDGIASLGGDTSRISLIDPANSHDLSRYAKCYERQRAHKGLTPDEALTAMRDPLNFAAMMVHDNAADGTVAGAVATSSDTIGAALRIIGKANDARIVSSFFLMLACASHHTGKAAMLFSDCGLVVEPDSEDLAAIALSSANSCQTLLDEKPQIAMLSFSTSGSSSHPRVSLVTRAAAILHKEHPELVVGGELQFDAAFEQTVRASKAPDSPIRDQPNVFIFPNLDSGNIGYKIAQRIGGMVAIGPVLQGLAKPANDLSRGCSVRDIEAMIAITVVQANIGREKSR